MKKLFVIIALLLSYAMGNSYSEGFKLYMQAKRDLRKGDVAQAKTLFLQAKDKFEIAGKKNSSQALLKLAELYCNGYGVNVDKIKAKTYLTDAQKLGASYISNQCLKNLK